MRHRKNQRILERFGKRLRAFREAAELSQEQVQHATGIGQSNITKMEAGKLNTSLSQLALLSELFGVDDHVLLDYRSSPEPDVIRQNVQMFLKRHGIDPTFFLRRKLSHLLQTKLLTSKFFNVPRYSKDVADHLMEKYGEEFSTSHISQALDGLTRKGLIEKISTDKKTKYQYLKKKSKLQ